MNEFLNRKTFVQALIGILNVGVTHYLDEDSEILLRAVRVLRPTFKELATFDGLLAIHQGKWEDGIRALAELDAVSPNWLMGKALLAVCKFGVNDPSWTVPANEVLAVDPSGAPAEFVRSMLGHAMPEAAGAPANSWSPSAHGDPRIAQYAGFGVV
jgi:type III secretion protein HrpB1